MSKPTILCVDDEQKVLVTLKSQLAQFADHALELVETAAKAFERIDHLLAEGREVPLVIADQILPEMSGDLFLLELHRRYPSILKVMLTVQDSSLDSDAAISHIVSQDILYRFLSKPWNPLDLQLTVREALRRYRQEQQLAQQQVALEQTNQTEVALQESEQRCRAILSALPDMLLISADGQYLSFSYNQFAGESILLPDIDFVGQYVTDVLPPKAAHQRLAAVQQTLKTGQTQTYEQQIQFSDRIQYEEVRIVPYQQDKVLCLVRDISINKQEEMIRQQTETALQESETRLQRLAENSPGMVYRYVRHADGSHSFPYVSPRCFDIYGVAAEAVMQQAGTLFATFHAEDQPAIQAASTASIHHPDQSSLVEHRIITPQGQEKWVQATTSLPVRKADGDIVWDGVAIDITSRKQAELALQESQKLIQQITDSSPNVIYIYDLVQQRNLYVNREVIASFHSAAEVMEQIDQTIKTLMHPDDLAGFDQYLQHLTSLADGEIAEFEYRMRHKTGEWRWFCSRDTAFKRDADGRVTQILGNAQDVTTRKQAEDALRQSEATQRALLSALPDLIMWVNRDGVCLDFFTTPNFKILGERDKLIGTRARDTMPLDLAERRIEAIAVALETGELQVYEQELWVEGAWQIEECRVVKCDNDKALVIGRDITQRKRAEEALRQSEERWQLAIEGSSDGIWDRNLTTNQYFLSPRCLEIVGYDGAEVDSLDKWLTYIHPDDQPALQSNLRAYLNRETSIYRTEYRMRCKDGSYKWLLVRGKAVWDETGTPVRFVGSLSDVTSRRQAELALQQLNQELEQRVQQRTQELQRSEQDLRTIFNNVYDAIFIYDLDGIILDVNNRALELHGVTREQLVHTAIADFSAPDAPLELLPIYFRRVQAGETVCFEWKGKHLANGSFFDLEVTLKMVSLGNRLVYLAGVRDITDRKQAEIALRDSEALFRAAFEQAAVGMVQANLQGYFTRVNQKFCDIIGYTETELLSRSFREITHPGDLEADQAQVDCLLAGEAPTFAMEKRYIRGDGTIVWVNLSVSLVRDIAGTPQYFIGAIKDITDSKVAEIALAESEERFRQIAENIGEVFWLTALEFNILYISPAFERIWGQPSEAVFGSRDNFINTIHPEDRERSLREMTHRTQKNVETEYRIICPDGEIRWIRDRAFPIRNSQGEIYRIAGLAEDITDSKLTKQALQEAQQFAQSIADQTPTALYIYDLINHRNLYSNRSIFDLLGYAHNETRRNEDMVLTLIHPDDIAVITQHHRKIAAAADGEKLEIEYRLRHANGEWRWFYSYDSVFKRNASGAVTQYIGSAQDITERKQLEQELRQINAELERRVAERTFDLQQAMESAQAANRAKTAFLSNMSHELRTPLNAILGFSQLLGRDSNLHPEQREHISIINRSGEHLLNLINGILAMSKIEAGQITLNVQEFDLQDLLKELEELFRLKAETKGLRLTIQAAATVSRYIQTDVSKLRQVLINLLSNAIKFTTTGEVLLHVQQGSLESLPDASSWSALRFAVVDTGYGIDLAEQTTVFEPFKQTQIGQQAAEGTGLGLPISRQFVQLMGGELCLDSTSGQGSTFYFTIPVEVIQEDLLPAALTQRVIGLADGQRSHRLLVVEDNRENQQFLVQLLRSVGFEVRAAKDGQEAVHLWQSWAPHLIWMDLRMPVMDGYTATQQIRALEQKLTNDSNNLLYRSYREAEQNSLPESSQENPTRGTTKILALTASAFEDERAAILAAGCDDFVLKPIVEALLFEKLGEHLGVRYIYQEQAVSAAKSTNLLFAAALEVMPSGWITQFQRAARIADEDLLLELLDQIPVNHAQLADALRELVSELQLDQLIQLSENQ
jgi:PAS domain S-box-containing protein